MSSGEEALCSEPEIRAETDLNSEPEVHAQLNQQTELESQEGQQESLGKPEASAQEKSSGTQTARRQPRESRKAKTPKWKQVGRRQVPVPSTDGRLKRVSRSGNVDVSHLKPSIRRRAAAAARSAAEQKKARNDIAALSTLRTDAPGGLVAERPLERTYQVSQAEILSQADKATVARASFALDLSETRLSPYILSKYSRSSRSLLVASARGHVSNMDWRRCKPNAELFLNETVRDATFLHSDAFFALARRKIVSIHDASGLQVHALRYHSHPGHVLFLPHHLLLASVSSQSAPTPRIVYTDTSNGLEVAAHALPLREIGAVRAAARDLSNGVIHVGHASGVVALWSPAMGKPLARISAVRAGGGIQHIAIDPERKELHALACNGVLNVWDLRQMRAVAEYNMRPSADAMAISQRGLLAVGTGASVEVIRRKGDRSSKFEVYVRDRLHGERITALDFCPFEDLLSVTCENGVKTMVVPGAGEAAFDARAPNPYETRGRRREIEVQTLLDKLPPGSIALNPDFVGGIDSDVQERSKELAQRVREKEYEYRVKKLGVKKAKGKNKIGKRLKRIQAHKKETTRSEREEKRSELEKIKGLAKRIEADNANDMQVVGDSAPLPKVLERFLPKKGLTPNK